MKRNKQIQMIGIAGGSGAGKTWLASAIERQLGRLVTRLSLDDFYRDRSHLTAARRERINFDHPRAIDWPAVERTLASARRGRSIRIPKYDFSTHSRRGRVRACQPGRIVVMDGLWLLSRRSIRRLFDLKVFIECPVRIRLMRRMRRDVRERGRTAAGVLAQFRKSVAPMHERFVAPQARWADVVLRPEVTAQDVRRLIAQLDVREGGTV